MDVDISGWLSCFFRVIKNIFREKMGEEKMERSTRQGPTPFLYHVW